AGLDGSLVQVGTDVVGQLIGGAIASLGAWLQGLANDVVQVSAQGPGARTPQPTAGSRRILQREALHGADEGHAPQAPRTFPGEQFEQDRTQCVNVGGGGNGAAVQLLGCAVIERGPDYRGGVLRVPGPYRRKLLGDAEVK